MVLKIGLQYLTLLIHQLLQLIFIGCRLFALYFTHLIWFLVVCCIHVSLALINHLICDVSKWLGLDVAIGFLCLDHLLFDAVIGIE